MREEFAVHLRKQKKIEILKLKRQKLQVNYIQITEEVKENNENEAQNMRIDKKVIRNEIGFESKQKNSNLPIEITDAQTILQLMSSLRSKCNHMSDNNKIIQGEVMTTLQALL